MSHMITMHFMVICYLTSMGYGRRNSKGMMQNRNTNHNFISMTGTMCPLPIDFHKILNLPHHKYTGWASNRTAYEILNVKGFIQSSRGAFKRGRLALPRRALAPPRIQVSYIFYNLTMK